MRFLILTLVLSLAPLHANYKQVHKVATKYKGQSIDTRAEYNILNRAIQKHSRKFKIPVHILFAIVEQESQFHHKVIHKPVKTWVQTTTGKWTRRVVRAKGLGGIIYGANKYILKPEGIKKHQLLQIEANVHAIAAILAFKIHATKSLKRGIMAYYGDMKSSKYYNSVMRKSRKYRA